MLPPVLEIYVVWHPGDTDGGTVAEAVIDHFHGTAFSGLIGGAVEVFVRSDGWNYPTDAPRPLPFGAEQPPVLGNADLTVVMPVLGLELAKAVEAGEPWADHIAEAVNCAQRHPKNVVLRPVSLATTQTKGRLAETFSSTQMIRWRGTDSRRDFCRDLVQSIAQDTLPHDGLLRVFVSHTKRSHNGGAAELEGLIDKVRRVIRGTKLKDFFDASDLQPGQSWPQELDNAASTSALLAVRTDLYASREWCQREVLHAKRAGMPVVTLDAISGIEERGSFLMDHMPRVAGDLTGGQSDADVLLALGQLVDECLKRKLWNRQRDLASQTELDAVAWWAPHAPEPTTLVEWLTKNPISGDSTGPVLLLHPDPPLGPNETDVLSDLADLCGIGGRLEVLTPRGLAARV